MRLELELYENIEIITRAFYNPYESLIFLHTAFTSRHYMKPFALRYIIP